MANVLPKLRAWNEGCLSVSFYRQWWCEGEKHKFEIFKNQHQWTTSRIWSVLKWFSYSLPVLLASVKERHQYYAKAGLCLRGVPMCLESETTITILGPGRNLTSWHSESWWCGGLSLPDEKASIRDMTMTPLNWKKRLACGHCEVLMPLDHSRKDSLLARAFDSNGHWKMGLLRPQWGSKEWVWNQGSPECLLVLPYKN